MKFDLRTLMLIGAIASLLVFVIFPIPVINQIKTMLYYNLIPYDLVFDPGYDATKVDGATVIDCLHGSKACPEGVHFKNDETGLIEDREVISGRTIDNALPLTETTPQITAPQPVIDAAFKADTIAYWIFGILIAVKITVIIYLIRRRRKKKV